MWRWKVGKTGWKKSPLQCILGQTVVACEQPVNNKSFGNAHFCSDYSFLFFLLFFFFFSKMAFYFYLTLLVGPARWIQLTAFLLCFGAQLNRRCFLLAETLCTSLFLSVLAYKKKQKKWLWNHKGWMGRQGITQTVTSGVFIKLGVESWLLIKTQRQKKTKQTSRQKW